MLFCLVFTTISFKAYDPRPALPHLRKNSLHKKAGDSEAKHDKMLNIVLGPFIQQKQERREKKEERQNKKEKGKRKTHIYTYICKEKRHVSGQK